MPIRLVDGVLSRTFDTFRACGGGRAECVAYWLGRAGADLVDDVVHPLHAGGPAGYQVNSLWVSELFLRLRADKKTVVAQVHTHPGLAWHSPTDDVYSLVPATGFLSLVIPRFAAGAIGLSDAALYEMQPNGLWDSRDPQEWILL